jgi:nucleoid-associated protein YgaU
MSGKRVLAVVIGAGVLGALPFLRNAPEPAAPPARSTAIADVPLEISLATEVSPAAGLYDEDAAEESPRFAHAQVGRSRLEDHGLPPDLPDRYRPLVSEAGSASDWTGEPVIAAPASERQHRTVDGDSLARLAQRYWGDATLAEALFQANRDVLAAPSPLPLGVTLRIPPRPALMEPGAVGAGPASPLSERLPAPARQPRVPEASTPLVPIPRGAFGSEEQ